MNTDVIINRDALYALRELPSESVNCCVTSPPYYGLRDYGLDAQIGREDTPEQYIGRLVEVFRELRRVLKDDGTFWLNIADTYCGTGMKAGCKQKDLIGIPWLLAFALRSDGWYLRSDIIWLKENPMPESCRDRPSRCYEHIFLLTKSKKYYYDAAAIAEPIAPGTAARYRQGRGAGHKYAEEVPGQGNDPDALKWLLREEHRNREQLPPGDFKAHIAALHDGLIETEARRIVREMKRHDTPNSPNKTHFMVELSPAFMQLANTKDIDRLFSMLPYKTLSFSKIEGRHGTYTLIDKGENRDKGIKKPRPSVRAQLTADKKTAAPKKAAAKRKNHDLEV